MNVEQMKRIDAQILLLKNRPLKEKYCLSSVPLAKEPSSIYGLDDATGKKIDAFISANRGTVQTTTLYDEVMIFLERLNRKLEGAFSRKNGAINEAKFYDYAYIDKSTWSSMKNNLIVPKKKTVLKLAIALQLNEDEAMRLMQKINDSFDYDDKQDLVILALLNLKIYDITTVIDTLEFYQMQGQPYFDSIYDSPEEQARKRKEFEEQRKKQHQQKFTGLTQA